RKPEDYLKVRDTELQQDIKTTGFFRNKTKSIQGACKMLVEDFQGEVPKTMEELLKLPGVARKTANVVLGVAYGIAVGIVVDTHVGRLSHRLRLTKQKDAVKIENDLLELVPKKDWIIFSHLLIFHGRRVCKARRPLCEECVVEELEDASELAFFLRSLVCFQDSLAQTDRFRCHFHQFVVGNKLERFFQRKIFHRHEAHRLVRSRRAHVRQLLFFDGVHVQVDGARVLANDHAFIDFRIRSNEKRAAFLQIEERVGRRFAHAIGNK